jgi:hypothetical protein
VLAPPPGIVKPVLSEREFRELVRVAYIKAAEFQARGLVHFHAIIRLDDPEDRGLPPGVAITANELAAAIGQAGRRAVVNGDVGGATVQMRFGKQLHARVVQDGADDDARDRGQVAAYVAKYSCKGSHEQIMGRGASPEQLREHGVPEQLVQMAMAAIRVSERAGLGAVGQWTHMLGFRGHFVTKSRGYSTTLGELRGARAEWRADRDDAALEDDSTPVLSVWEYVGCGYLNPGDVLLAAGVEASIGVAREALIESGADHRRGCFRTACQDDGHAEGRS